MLFTEVPISALVRPEQSRKQFLPIEVTESGIIMLVNPEHLEKAYAPIFVTVLGMVTFVNIDWFTKALLPSCVIVNEAEPSEAVDGITRFVVLEILLPGDDDDVPALVWHVLAFSSSTVYIKVEPS